MDKHILYGHKDYLYVEPKAPVLYVPYITPYTLFHLPQLLCLPAIAGNLSPSGDARFREMANHVFAYQLRIYVSVMQHVWSWPYNAHVSLQNIEELWQLINVGLAHEIAKGELPRVVLCGLFQVGILIHMHRPELVAVEGLPVQSRPFLLEEYRSWTLYLYYQSNDWYEWQHAYASHYAEAYVE